MVNLSLLFIDQNNAGQECSFDPAVAVDRLPGEDIQRALRTFEPSIPSRFEIIRSVDLLPPAIKYFNMEEGGIAIKEKLEDLVDTVAVR